MPSDPTDHVDLDVAAQVEALLTPTVEGSNAGPVHPERLPAAGETPLPVGEEG